LDKIIFKYFGYKNKKADLKIWNKLVSKIIDPKDEINI
jgi:hypothetical protein